MQKWDIYLAKVRFEENRRRYKRRPVLILDPSTVLILSFKITSHEPRTNFPGEYQIVQWREAGLLRPSVVRCSQIIDLTHEDIERYLGKLQPEDIRGVQEIVRRELPEYSHLVEEFIPDDDPMFYRSIF